MESVAVYLFTLRPIGYSRGQCTHYFFTVIFCSTPYLMHIAVSIFALVHPSLLYHNVGKCSIETLAWFKFNAITDWPKSLNLPNYILHIELFSVNSQILHVLLFGKQDFSQDFRIGCPIPSRPIAFNTQKLIILNNFALSQHKQTTECSVHVWAAVKKYNKRTRVGIESTTSWLLDRHHTTRPLRVPDGYGWFNLHNSSRYMYMYCTFIYQLMNYRLGGLLIILNNFALSPTW